MNSRSKKFFTRGKGFTLIELMVVIVIIGIVLLFVIPSFARMQRRARIKAGAEEVAQDFRHFRERALSRAQTYTIIPDSAPYRGYKVISPANDTTLTKLGETTGGLLRFGSTSGASLPGYGGPGPDGFAFPANTCEFFGRGHASAGAAYITDGEQDYAIEVNRIGKIKVWLYNGTTWL